MTLLITFFAAAIFTVVWYRSSKKQELMLAFPCWMFWGAAIMWTVDAVFEFAENGAEYFTPPIEDALNDAFLGLSVVALELIIWAVALLIKDPKGVFRKNNKQ